MRETKTKLYSKFIISILRLVGHINGLQSQNIIDTVYYSDTAFSDNLNEVNYGPVSLCKNDHHHVKWFSFTALSSKLNISLIVGDSSNALSHSYLSLFDNNLVEVDCRKYRLGHYNLGISRDDINVGEVYYIGVDNANRSAYAGYFNLTIDSLLSHDFPSAALLLDHSYSSTDALHTTMNGSPDGNKPSCWTTGPNYNKWFQFKATSNYLHLSLETNNEKGDIEKPYLALFDQQFNELSCERFHGSEYNIDLEYQSLIKDSIYYISIDNSAQSRYIGSYTLSLSNTFIPGGQVGGALALIDINFEIHEKEDQVCFTSDSTYGYFIEYTADGEDIYPLNIANGDCIEVNILEQGYYRMTNGADYSEWVYYVPKNDQLIQNKLGIYNLQGKQIENASPGISILIYEEGGVVKSEKRISF